MANEFESWYARTRQPTWINGKWGKLWGGVIGYFFDRLLDGIRQGVLAGFVASTPDDSVILHSRMRMIEPIPGETIAALRLRVLDAWNHWSDGGPPTDLAAKLAAYLLIPGTSALAVFSPAFDGWSTDDNAPNASRLWVVVGVDADGNPCRWTQILVGGLMVGDGLLVGISMTPEELSRARRIFKRYKPGHVVGAELIVAFDKHPADILANIAATTNMVRIALQAPMVGYGSSIGTVGPATRVGIEFQ